ncbi:MAG TPA: hypothetical protein VJL10_00080, partial [Anaerolineales bacterium]|nr:hypothetical protein [Anaerolineales bacterium]
GLVASRELYGLTEDEIKIGVIDPKGFLRQPSSCLAGRSDITGRESAGKTFRVSHRKQIVSHARSSRWTSPLIGWSLRVRDQRLMI